jgi:hypothetical protein
MSDADSDLRIASKLQAVDRDLELLKEQGKVEGFLANVDNADRVRGLVEDIRDAMIQYQVCFGNVRTPQHL